MNLLDPANRDRLLEQRVVVLDGEITGEIAQNVIARMLFLHDQDSTAAIHLLVDSPGGDVVSGFAIIDTIDQISPPIFTYCYGQADALAAMIVAHGFKSRRYARTTAGFSLCHPQFENPHDDDAAELSRIANLMAEAIAADTSQSIEQIQRDLRIPLRSMPPQQRNTDWLTRLCKTILKRRFDIDGHRGRSAADH